MQPSLLSHVAAANELTGRWCERAGSDDFVLSGCGVWPLLGILADAADEPARSELAAAASIAAPAARRAASALLAELTDADSTAAALGVWVRPDIALHEAWVRTLPPGTVEKLTGQPALDAWADRHTRGLIDRFPLDVQPDTLLILATAIVAKTAWRTPFHDDVLEPESGPWAGHRGPGLSRDSETLTDATVLAAPTPVTRVVVRGTGDLDVHLLLGDASPAEVLRAGLGVLDGSIEAHTALRIGDTGPGLTVRETRATTDTLRIQLPPFVIRSSHDLMKHPDLFGLHTAADPRTGHFPALSDTPLRVDGAAQHALARFTREGFEAAAVTAVRMVRAVAYRRPHRTTEVAVTFDRPFGFLAVHRPTGLAVVAGWVAAPPKSR
ncbi:serpin family protein [Nocardia macrotermitis]|uniref:serpin family protein n=1 Tax=Nocardia macrotermitis TaxID=2585198 RepID=UPI0029E80EB1|nr:serpin family protein [Nocardia macrotermitis]